MRNRTLADVNKLLNVRIDSFYFMDEGSAANQEPVLHEYGVSPFGVLSYM